MTQGRLYWPYRFTWLSEWMACEWPERPYERGATGYHHPDDCHACAIAAVAAYRQADDELRRWFEYAWTFSTWPGGAWVVFCDDPSSIIP